MLEFSISDDLSDAKDASGRTLLHLSAKNGKSELAKYLIAKGCSVDAQDNEGMTPLMLAVLEHHDEVVETLLNANASMYIGKCAGKNVLQLAFSNPDIPPKTLLPLLRRVQNSSSTTDRIASKLITAGCPLFSAVLLRNTALINRMIVRGVDIEMKDKKLGWTALFWAVDQCDSATTTLLLEHKANVNATDDFDFSPLARLHAHSCSCENCFGRESEKLEIVRSLIDEGASLVSINSIGLFSCWSLLFQGSREAIEMILKSVKDFSVKDNYQQTLLMYLVQNKNPEVIEEVKVYIREFDVNAYNTSGKCVLLQATASNNLDAVKLLLENGAYVNCIQEDTAETPLYKCFLMNSKENVDNDQYDECVKILLEYNADPQIVCKILGVKTLFDAALVFRQTERFKLVLARLAINERLGIELTQLSKSKIHSDETFKEYYGGCKKVLQMKFDCNLDLFELLTADDEILANHLNSAKCLRKLILFNDNTEIKASHKYYYDVLKKKIIKIFGVCECVMPMKVLAEFYIMKFAMLNEKVLGRHLKSAKYLRELLPICYDTDTFSHVKDLKDRIVPIIYRTDLEEEASVGIEKVFRCRINNDNLITSEIISYLDDDSLKNLSCM